jgi:periplasmic protein TonB
MRRQPAQLASGLTVHLVLALLLGAFLGAPRDTQAPAPPTRAAVWAAHQGYSGGGRGGNGVRASPAPRPPAEPAERFTLPQIPPVAGALELPGTAVLSAASASGLGTDDGPSNGSGAGLGGPGAGLRSGSGSGDGDGPFLDGAPGVTSPRLIYEKPPEYTAAAMAAKVQGTVLLEATVRVDGTVGAVRVLRSLDERSGLDQKAVETIRGWKFRPGTYLGKPAPVKVLIELSFNLR